MTQNNKKNVIALQIKGNKFWKKDKNAFAHYLNWKNSLLQVYLSHFITKQGTIFEDIRFKPGTQFFSACSCSDLIYYGPANWAFRRQITCADYFIIIIYHEVFCIFFPINFSKKLFSFLLWRKKISRHLVKGFLL